MVYYFAMGPRTNKGQRNKFMYEDIFSFPISVQINKSIIAAAPTFLVLQYPAGIDVFHGRNRDPEYSVRFNGTRQINGATIPESIRIENEKGETVTIIIRRFWPASDIEAEKFILTAPS